MYNRHVMSGDSRYILNLIFLGLLTFLLLCCSKPTSPEINRQVVLRMMLGFPAIPFPPETEENATDYGFIATKEYCQFLANIRKPLETWIQILLDENIPAVQEEHSGTVGFGDTIFVWTSLTWTRMHHDGESIFVLRVSLASRWYFGMDWTGPAYETFSPKGLSGWVFPAGISGNMYGTWGNLGWETASNSMHYNAGTDTLGYLLADNLDGSGSVLVQGYRRILVFRSDWDNLGHGSWRSATDCGEW